VPGWTGIDPVEEDAMTIARWAAVACLGAGSVAFAREADDERPGFKALSAQAAETYNGARAKLSELGAQARAAAAAGDYAKWVPVNAAYLDALATVQSICEANVRDLTSKPGDLADVGTKRVFPVLKPYLDGAPPLLKARLHLIAYGNLMETTDPTERKSGLEALAPLYFIAK
jgi:hypothetical protein